MALQTAGLTLVLNYGVHYASARLYDMFCVPHSLQEVFQSLVTTASPACGFLLNTMHFTQNNYAVVITTTLANVIRSVL